MDELKLNMISNKLLSGLTWSFMLKVEMLQVEKLARNIFYILRNLSNFALAIEALIDGKMAKNMIRLSVNALF